MKLKHIFLLSVASLALAACSDDDKSTPEITGNAIRFNASAPLAPRAVTTTDNLDNFRVTAFVGGKKYMDNVPVIKTGNTWTYSPTMYWPADETVNFFSYSPDNITTNSAEKSGTDIKGFVNDGTTDFLYGVNMDESGKTSKMVKINFRHALSQVRFYLKRKVQDPAIRVDVTGVALTKINSVGDFAFPRATTAQGSVAYGTWSAQSLPTDPAIYTGAPATLTDNGTELNPGSYYFFIPQKLEQAGENTADGAFVKVTCAIYHEGTGTRIWPSGADYGDIYFPLNTTGTGSQAVTEWLQGRAYVYNLTIGVPSESSVIEFDVTVDEYQNFAESDLENN